MEPSAADTGSALPFRPGFRIDVIDTLVLVAGAAGSLVAARTEWWMGALIAFAVGHFFLFCNVVRMARPLELGWSALFVTLSASTIVTGQPGWAIALGASLACTLAVVVIQLRRPSYHGIAWQRINPQLPAWWEAHGGLPVRSR